ncbi:hypothetical protein FA15DRAFT_642627 [Coprinopsis marcescibilis]|uniref:DUF3533 domain-containing protein n=1 Tax=Coprinopsis marcescibilis TaxID=230819 RepID=A0A5C3KU54_COPMA|nr:hypothetical protein FA15DRAFT_642627 [Coprinopsis marcescibilis]
MADTESHTISRQASRSRTSMVDEVDDATTREKEDMGPGSLGFFDRSPEGNLARATYLKIFIIGTVSVMVMIFTLLPIYWGALWKTPERNLDGWVVDFDGGQIGEQVMNALASNSGVGKITWHVQSAESFPGSLEDLRTSVREEHTWAAIAVAPGTTERLGATLASPNQTYDGSRAILAFAVEARSENGYRSLIRPSIEGALTIISRQIALQVAARASSSANIQAILQDSPQTIVNPVGFTLENLIPYDQPVATAATFVGMLYQLIMGFFVVMICMAAREASGYEKRLSTRALIGLRLASAFTAYFFISLLYSAMNMAFQLDVTRKFGNAGFVVFWMINFAGLAAMCMTLESMITLLTPKGIPFFMLLWIITNLSVTLFPIEVLPTLFRYGYAWPFYNTSVALRTVIFGTENHLGRSFGILYGWAALSCLTLCLFQWMRRRPTKAEVSKDISSPSSNTVVLSRPEKSKAEA